MRIRIEMMMMMKNKMQQEKMNAAKGKNHAEEATYILTKRGID